MSDPPPTRYEYDTATVRQLLTEAFNDEEFSIFCFDHFPVVYKDFTLGMTFRAKVQLLVEHCQQDNTFDELLPLVRASNPNRYAEFSDLLVKTQPVRSVPTEQRLETAPESPTKIFLSYSRQDSPVARRLATDLQQAGFAVWWDVSDLQGGESWGRTIQAAIRASQCCLVLLSPNSIESEWVEREYMYAMRRGLKIIPLLYHECDIPLALINKQYLDFQGSNYEWGLRQLLATLAGKDVPRFQQPGQDRPKKKVLAARRKPLWAGIGAGAMALMLLGWVVYSFYPGPSSPSPTAAPSHTVTVVVIAPTATHTPTPLSTAAPPPTPPPTETQVLPTNTPPNTPPPTDTPFSPTNTPVPPTSTPLPLTPTDTPMPIIGRIAFTSDRDGNYEIYMMNADSSDQTNLTNNSADDGQPAWSPDGTRIAFVSDRDGNDEIYVINIDDNEVIRLTNDLAGDWSPAWPPDGVHIAFVSDRDSEYGDIYVMNVDGSKIVALTDPSFGTDLFPAWSPDSTRITFMYWGDGNHEIYMMNADGSYRTRLTNNQIADSFPDWSPNGVTIAFTSARDEDDEIYLMNVDGSALVRLTNSPAKDWFPTWSVDGTRIAFQSERDGNSEIYVMNTDGSGQTNLTNSLASDTDPDWGLR